MTRSEFAFRMSNPNISSNEEINSVRSVIYRTNQSTKMIPVRREVSLTMQEEALKTQSTK